MSVAFKGRSQLDIFSGRADSLLSGISYFLLAFSSLFAAVNDRVAWPHRIGTLGFAALVVVWLWALKRFGRADNARRVLRAGLYLGLLVLIAVLVHRDPLFGFFAFSGYLYVDRLPRRWALIGVAGAAFLIASSQAGGLPPPASTGVALYVGLIAINLVVAAAMMSLSWVLEQQSEHRKQMVTELSETNHRLEQAIAENAGLHAQLVTQAREAGVLDERQRLAREIHDTLAQGLIGIITQLQAAEQAPDGTPARRRHLDTAARLSRDSLSEARRSVHALRPEPLESAQLPQALAEVVRQWSHVTGVHAAARTTGTARPLHPQVEVTLLRMTQEALANVAKHANASRTDVTLSYMEDLVTLDVRDDGVGFDPSRAAPTSPRLDGGFGLIAMRQRLTGIDGTLEIESEPGSGTAVSASVPSVPSVPSLVPDGCQAAR
jgi:signal transduction histidine kinase